MTNWAACSGPPGRPLPARPQRPPGKPPSWTEYDELPVLAYVKETYDTTVAFALAAQAAGSVDGAAIRDRLRKSPAPLGRVFLALPTVYPTRCPC